MKEQRIIYIKKTSEENTPLTNDIACMDCPSAGWTSGLTAKYLAELKYTFQKINFEANGGKANKSMKELLDIEAEKEVSNKQIMTLEEYLTDSEYKEGVSCLEDFEENYKEYVSEQRANQKSEILKNEVWVSGAKHRINIETEKTEVEEFWKKPENNELFKEYLETQKRNSLNCYCKEQHQYTFKSGADNNLFIIDCDFKNKLIENERINSVSPKTDPFE